jgi:hypothetical protein
MTTKHTPGPWECVEYGRGEASILSTPLRGTQQWVAHIHRIPGKDIHRMVKTTEADARLIAAAPDLLEALKLCAVLIHDGNRQGDAAIEAARAAIAKATGA